MLVFEGREWSFRQMEEESNRVARALTGGGGLARGDVAALFMENRPEFVAAWLGMSKAGVVPALVNSSLRQDSLVHSVTVVDCKAVVFGYELAEGA